MLLEDKYDLGIRRQCLALQLLQTIFGLLNFKPSLSRFHYTTFVSPFSPECFGRPQDMDYPVTKEYHMAHLIRSRLPPIDLEKKEEDTLFWLFYNCTGEDIQLAAAKEL